MQLILGSEELICLGKLLKYTDKDKQSLVILLGVFPVILLWFPNFNVHLGVVSKMQIPVL